MTNLFLETRLSLTRLAQRENINASSVWRWAQRGVRGVLLETFCVGGRRFTSEEAFVRFVDRTTAAANFNSTNSSADSQREEEIGRTESELDEIGIGTTSFQSAKKSDPLESGHNSQAPGIAPFDKQGAK